ncbi:MAG: cupredoxin domain-containing protein [Candidatus Aenigmatarchaeota archaeon]
MKNKSLILAIIVISIIGLVLFFPNYSNIQLQTQNQTVESGNVHIVEIYSNGFVPQTLRIKVGDTVTFVNKDSSPHWPASDPHPTHTDYPEKGGCISSAFDTCRGLRQGESWNFTFKYKGTWNYHDHLNPSLRGTIIVE